MNKRFVVGITSLFLIALQSNAFAVEWLTDLPSAFARAKTENKALLLDFTGSDWCGWCIKLKKEVFDQPEFATYAQQNLIMAEVDFPRTKPQAPELRAANEDLARRLKVEAFPTIIVIDANGKILLRDGYQAGGAQNYIAMLEKAIKGFVPTAPAAPTPPPEPEKPATPLPPAKPWQPIPEAPPTVFSTLALKGIVGSGERRFALINNLTLAVGEKGMVKMQSGPVEIMCKEIRSTSVLVQVKGEAESKELKLKTN